MKLMIIILIFTGLLQFSAKALNCANNPCKLGGYFTAKKGYECFQVNHEAFCTCPNGGLEINQQCRVCNRTDPRKNACMPSPNLLACLETQEYGGSFACLCKNRLGPVVTISSNCDSLVTVTSTMTTASSATVSAMSSTCFNGGYLVDGNCHCPSGFSGTLCEQIFDAQLCERISCKNGGACAIRNPDGHYESICLCRQGTSGEYCEFRGTPGFCTRNSCMNSVNCHETLIGSTRHAYCNCLPGYSGTTCENQYFKCTSDGKFIDSFMNDQGKYFQCTQANESYRLEIKSCPKGLRFNQNKNTCTLY
ncbi:unnamed protein product [Rotaria socialis]|uniref:Uncharacterized protein n=1 Tax=Rotaria socialis TaxID=392032 RepID=A0A818QUF8_9BILA|nr:unnamed protein product [Rotaria socialis]CAF3639653.1 unnamed protein product [Rotaria socialis]CAF4514516.1 unnamed protein product [Rotaria socialis]CAF4619671.1 unnamed protein product [Rotaria socialis]